MRDSLITIITPTYNRCHTLPVCYDSLCKQTDQRFHWMIIDDGSTDSTEKLVNEWISESLISIEYRKKNNGGKASALNVGISLLRTKYAVCLDSDDYFFPEAIELALHQLESQENDQKSCGLLALRNNPDGSVMGNRPIPTSYRTITAFDIFLVLDLNTELICFYKSSILKQYSFPVYENEKFVSPAWMQYEITQDYYYYTSWDKFCCCEYINDGLTKNKQRVIKKNPMGYTCVKRYSFDLAPSAKLKIKHGIMYDYGCLLSKDKDWLKNTKHKILAPLLMPLAFGVKLIRNTK